MHRPGERVRQQRRERACVADLRLGRAGARGGLGVVAERAGLVEERARWAAGWPAARPARWRCRPRRPRCVTIAWNGGWSNWSVWPGATGDQPQLRAERQLVALRRRRARCSRWTRSPSSPVKVAVSVRGSHPVGLRKKPGRSTGSRLAAAAAALPRASVGMSIDTTSTPVSDSRRIDAVHQHHVAEVDRADLGGHVDRDRGRVAGLASPPRGTARPGTVSRLLPEPTVLRIVPIRVDSGQVPACAWASGHCGSRREAADRAGRAATA